MRRHELDVVSMVFGLIFAVVAVLWPLWQLDVLSWDQLSWVPALALVAIGLLGVGLSIARSRQPSARDETPESPVDEEERSVLD